MAGVRNHRDLGNTKKSELETDISLLVKKDIRIFFLTTDSKFVVTERMKV